MSESSSWSSWFSTDGLSLSLEEDSDGTEMLKYIVDDETNTKAIELLMKRR